MDSIVEVFWFYLALRFRQFGSLKLLHGVCHICRDDEAFHIIMKPHAICGGLRNGRQKLFEVCRGAFAPVKGRRHDVHHRLSDRCCRRALGSSLDGAEELMQVVLVDCSKTRSICCAEERLVIWAQTIDVIAASMASFNPIAASLAVFCLSASSHASAFVMISGATMLSFYLAASASAIDCFLTSLFLMKTFDW